MAKITSCRNGCTYSQRKQQLWQIVAERQAGCCVRTLAEETGLSIVEIDTILEDLYVEGNVYFWHGSKT